MPKIDIELLKNPRDEDMEKIIEKIIKEWPITLLNSIMTEYLFTFDREGKCMKKQFEIKNRNQQNTCDMEHHD